MAVWGGQTNLPFETGLQFRPRRHIRERQQPHCPAGPAIDTPPPLAHGGLLTCLPPGQSIGSARQGVQGSRRRLFAPVAWSGGASPRSVCPPSVSGARGKNGVSILSPDGTRPLGQRERLQHTLWNDSQRLLASSSASHGGLGSKQLGAGPDTSSGRESEVAEGYYQMAPLEANGFLPRTGRAAPVAGRVPLELGRESVAG